MEGGQPEADYSSKLLVINELIKGGGGSKNRKNESTSFMDAPLRVIVVHTVCCGEIEWQKNTTPKILPKSTHELRNNYYRVEVIFHWNAPKTGVSSFKGQKGQKVENPILW